MVTPLSVYGLSSASGTLSTANKFTTTTGGTGTNETTKLNSGLNYGEVYSQGTTNAWAGLGSIGVPSGNGFLWDVTTLEGQDLIAGNWTASTHMSVANNSGNVIADIIMRAYKRSSGGIYTPIGSMTLAAQTFTTTLTIYNLPSTAFPKMSFGVGDKLYGDIWLNVTTNAGSTTTINFTVTVTTGKANNAEWDTAGYQPTPAATLVLPFYQHKRVGELVLA